MAAKDYMVDTTRIPQLGPPDFADSLYKMIRGVPQAYQEGAEGAFKRGQFARTEEIQKPFVDEKGNAITDLQKLQDHLLKVGGAEYAKELFPYISGKAADQALGAGAYPSGGVTGAPLPSVPGTRRTEAEILTDAAQANNASAPDTSGTSASRVVPGGGPTGWTVRSLATDVFGGDKDVSQLIPRFAAVAGVDPNKIDDTELKPEQVDRLQGIMQRSKEALAAGGKIGTPAYTRTTSLGSQPASSMPPGAGQAPSPAPQAAQPPPPVAQVAQAQAPPQPNQASSAEARAQVLENEANRREKILIEQGRNASPAAKEGALEGIRNLRAQATTLRANEAAITKETDPRIRQAEGLKQAQGEEVKQGGALRNSINSAARDFQQGLAPHLDLMRGIMNDPNPATGTAVDWKVAWNKFRADPHFAGLPGYDPNAALPNEGLRKVLAASVLNQIGSLKDEAAALGGSSGRIFQQQVQLAMDASQNDSNTLPALRYLTEVQSRIGQHQVAVQELLNNYVGQFGKGIPDNNFNQVLAKYNADHPLFSSTEIADHKLIAPPVAPETQDTAKIKAWSEHNGLEAGDPIKVRGKITPWNPAKMLKIEIHPGPNSRDRT